MKDLPVLKRQCKTCPFKAGSPHAGLSGALAASALSEASRICHSTGGNNAINRRTRKKPALCRGARDVQLQYFTAIGFLPKPTDACWAKKLAELRAKQNK
jgi:hypothetical protein